MNILYSIRSITADSLIRLGWFIAPPEYLQEMINLACEIEHE